MNYFYLTESGEDDYNTACLMMVFVAVAIPKLARSDFAFYKASLEGENANYLLVVYYSPTIYY